MEHCHGSLKDLESPALSKTLSENYLENHHKESLRLAKEGSKGAFSVFTSSLTAFKRYNSESMETPTANRTNKAISDTIPSFIQNFANQFPNIRHPNIKKEMFNEQEAAKPHSHETFASSLMNEKLFATLTNGPNRSNPADDVAQAVNYISKGKFEGELAELCLNLPGKGESQGKDGASLSQNYLQEKLQKLTEIEKKIIHLTASYRSPTNAQKIQFQTEKSKKAGSNKKANFLNGPYASSKKTVPHKFENSDSIVSSITSLDEDIERSLRVQSTPSGNLNFQFENLTLNAIESEPTIEKGKIDYKISLFELGKNLGVLRSLPNLNAMNLLEIILSNSNHTNHDIDSSKNLLKAIKEEDSEDRIDGGTSKSVPGIYSRPERMLRILRYKKKIVKWRLNHPLTRNFSGRSQVAGSKPRIKGKFVSKEEYQKYMETHKSEGGQPMEEETDFQNQKQNI